MIKIPEASQDLSEAGIRANIEYLMARQTKRLADNMQDGQEVEQLVTRLYESICEATVVKTMPDEDWDKWQEQVSASIKYLK